MMRLLSIVMMIALSGACGGDDGGTDAAPDANLPDAPGADADLPDAPAADADSPDAPVGDASEPDGMAPDAGDAAVSMVEARFDEPVVYINCMPIVAPDPFIAWFTLVVDNSAGAEPVNARISEATLSLAEGEALDLSFDVEAVMVRPGEVSRTMHRKTSSMPVLRAPCTRFCRTSATLRVTLDVGGGRLITLDSEQMLSCPV